MNPNQTVQARNPLMRVLATSWVARPWLALTAGYQQHWVTLWPKTLWGGGLWRLLLNRADHPAAMLLHGWIPGILWVGVMGLCVAFDTGMIGAGTWAVFGWLVATSLLMRHNKWLTALHPLDGLVLLWFATYVVAAAFSSYRHEALAGLFKMATFFAGYASVRMMLTQQPRLWWVWVLTLFGLGVAEAGIGVLQNQQHVDPLATWSDTRINPDQALTRVFGTLKPYNPNLLAGYLVPTWAAGLWILGQAVAMPGITRRWPWMLLIALGMAVISVGIMLTGSRGGYLGLGGMVLASFLLAWPVIKIDVFTRRKPWIMQAWWGLFGLAIAGVTAALIGSPKLANRLMSIGKFYEDSSIAYRLHVYESSWRMFLDNWLVGVGPGNLVFKQVYGFYMTPGFNALGTYSVPLSVAVEQGVVGLVAAWLVVKGVLTDRILWWVDDRLTHSQRLALMAWLVGLFGVFCHGLFDTVFYRPAIQMTVWIWIAGLIAALPGFFVGPKVNTESTHLTN